MGVKNETTKAIRNHVTLVYAFTFLGCSFAAIGSKMHLTNSSLFGFPIQAGFHWTIIQAIAIAVIQASSNSPTTSKTNNISVWRAAVFFILAFSAGVNVGSWFQYALQEVGLCRGNGFSFFPDLDFLSKILGGSSKYCSASSANSLVFEAIGTTAGIYICFALASYLSRGWSKFVGLVSAGFWIMFASSLFAWMGWISTHTFEDIYVKGGLVLYAFKVMVDTDILLENARNGYMDVVGSACNTMMNILHLLIRVVKLIGDREKDKKRRN